MFYRHYHTQKIIERHIEDLKSELICTLDYPEYVCAICEYRTLHSSEMIQHFHKEHSLKEMPFITSKEDRQTPSYIILSELVNRSKFANAKKFLRVSNKELHSQLKELINDNISNQTPAHTLKKLGFKKYCKHDKTGARIYYISIYQLKKIVSKTTFDDLKYRLGLIDENRIVPKPLSPTSEEEQKEDSKTEKSEKYIIDDLNEFDLSPM